MSAAAAARKKPKAGSPSLTGVFERLLTDIVSGRYPAGSRLPAERDLALVVGASRPTLREALRRLGEWRLIEPRRGSGVVVRPARDWSMSVLPAYLRLGGSLLSGPQLGQLVADLLGVRRSLFLEVLRQVAPRITAGSLGTARAAAEDAWTHRDDVGEFVARDFEAFRAVIEAAGFLPALWLLNDLAGVYLGIARTLTGVARLPDDYLATWKTVFDALEDGQPRTACEAMRAYLERHDRRLLAALGIST